MFTVRLLLFFFFHFISSLNPQLVFDDGRSQLLLCLHGLLPISFRGASYNIPIAVWLTRDYPRDPPIVYVIPTTDMLIKAGKYIDVSGRCNIEYIQLWARKNEVVLFFTSTRSPSHLSSRRAIYQPCSRPCNTSSPGSLLYTPNLPIYHPPVTLAIIKVNPLPLCHRLSMFHLHLLHSLRSRSYRLIFRQSTFGLRLNSHPVAM